MAIRHFTFPMNSTSEEMYTRLCNRFQNERVFKTFDMKTREKKLQTYEFLFLTELGIYITDGSYQLIKTLLFF